MSGVFPGFATSSSGGSGGASTVSGRGPVVNVGGAETGAVLMGMPFHYTGGARIENSDGIDGPITFTTIPDGVLITAEGVNCSAVADIEIGMASQEGHDTFIIDSVVFWKPTSVPTVLRGTLSSEKNAGGTIIVPATQAYTSLTADDKILDIPITDKRVARYPSLWWRPTVAEDLRINVTVFRRILRQVQIISN